MSSEALENALQDYEGTLLIVSHDRYLINKIADRIYYLDSTGVTEYGGNYDYFLERRRESQRQQEAEEQKSAPRVNEYKLRKLRDSELRKLRTALRRTEEEIQKTEEEIAGVEEELQKPEIAADYQSVADLSERLAALKEHSDSLYIRWGDLSEQLESS